MSKSETSFFSNGMWYGGGTSTLDGPVITDEDSSGLAGEGA